MRELEFRAWDKATKKYYNVAGLSFEKGRLVEVYLENYLTSFEGNEDCKKPDEVILEQDTGLFDCNSQKIHEGDIVRYVSVDSEYLMSQVEFDECCFGTDYEEGATFLTGFALRKVKDAIKPTDISDDDWEDWMDVLREDCQVEIIGNINENPELLERQK